MTLAVSLKSMVILRYVSEICLKAGMGLHLFSLLQWQVVEISVANLYLPIGIAMSSNQALSFSSVYDEFYIKILHYLKRMVGEFEAEEDTQTVFEKISRNLSSFKGESKLSPRYIGLPQTQHWTN